MKTINDRLYLYSCTFGAKTGGAAEKRSEDFILDTPANTQLNDHPDNFVALMRRVREGSEAAAWELVDKYGGHLRRAVRRVLNPMLRSKFDSLDFVQLVWDSFFRRRDPGATTWTVSSNRNTSSSSWPAWPARRSRWKPAAGRVGATRRRTRGHSGPTLA